MGLGDQDINRACVYYNLYFEGKRTIENKAYTILDLMRIFDNVVSYMKTSKEQPFLHSVIDNMVDTIIFDNGNKVLDPKDRDQLISITYRLNDYSGFEDNHKRAQALAVVTINRFYNSFRS